MARVFYVYGEDLARTKAYGTGLVQMKVAEQTCVAWKEKSCREIAGRLGTSGS